MFNRQSNVQFIDINVQTIKMFFFFISCQFALIAADIV